MSLEQYELTPIKKQGGMSTSYFGRDKTLEREVFVKRISLNGDLANSFEKDGRILASLEHPGLARVYNAFVQDGFGYVVQELINGETIDKLLDSDSINEQQAASYMLEAARVLEYCHTQGVIQKDVKPSNIMIDDKGQVKLIDFGISVKLGDARLTKLLALYGSSGYTPIEQYVEGAVPNFQTDVYGFGATLYKLLTKKDPPDAVARSLGQTDFERIPQISSWSQGLQELIDKTTEQDHGKRLKDMGEVVRKLEGIVKIKYEINDNIMKDKSKISGFADYFVYGMAASTIIPFSGITLALGRSEVEMEQKSWQEHLGAVLGGISGVGFSIGGLIIGGTIDPTLGVAFWGIPSILVAYNEIKNKDRFKHLAGFDSEDALVIDINFVPKRRKQSQNSEHQEFTALGLPFHQRKTKTAEPQKFISDSKDPVVEDEFRDEPVYVTDIGEFGVQRKQV